MATLAPFDQNKVNQAVYRVFIEPKLRNALIEIVRSKNYINGRTAIRHALGWDASHQNMTTVVAIEVMIRMRMILFDEDSSEAERTIIPTMPGWVRDGLSSTSYDEFAITNYLISNNLKWNVLREMILGYTAYTPEPELEPEPKETTMNSTTCDTNDTSTPVIETRVMIHGKFADTMTDTEIFQLIARLEQNVETLDKIKNKPKKLKNKIKEIEDSIQKLSEYVDGR